MDSIKLLLVAVLCFFTIAVLPCGLPASSGVNHLSVLMYHRFDAGGTISTPMESFTQQMNYLIENNYNFIALEEVQQTFQSGGTFPEKSVLITIDDGYKSTYTKAYPFLKKHDIPWALYIYTESIENQYPSALSWEQVREMAESDLVSVGNHTFSHGHPIDDSFRRGDWIEREIKEPHELIEAKTGEDVTSFAIPYGEYDRRLIEVLQDTMNYDIVWGIDPGVVETTSKAPVLPRFGVNRSTSWSEFKKKLRRLPLSVERAVPEPGSIVSGGEKIIVELKFPWRFREGPLNLFFSETGALDWSWGNNKKSIHAEVPDELTEDWNRIIVTAFDHEKNRYRFYSHGLVTTD